MDEPFLRSMKSRSYSCIRCYHELTKCFVHAFPQAFYYIYIHAFPPSIISNSLIEGYIRCNLRESRRQKFSGVACCSQVPENTLEASNIRESKIQTFLEWHVRKTRSNLQESKTQFFFCSGVVTFSST